MSATRTIKLNKPAAFLAAYGTLAGCTFPADKHLPDPQTSTVETARENSSEYNVQVQPGQEPEQEWTELKRGQNSGGFEFSTDGSLFYSGKLLAESIMVSATTSLSGTRYLYAHRLFISPLSPDKEYAIVVGCEDGGFCWAIFRARLSTGQFDSLPAGMKYGIDSWVVWLPPDHAIFRSEVEGKNYFFRVHLPTSTSVPCETGRCHLP